MRSFSCYFTWITYMRLARPNSMSLLVLSVPWFLPLIMGTKGKGEDGKGGEEKQRQRGKKMQLHLWEDSSSRCTSVGQTEHSAQCINMALNNSDFETTGRGFPGGGKVVIIKPSLARGGSCMLQQTQETGHGLIAGESRDAVVQHCVRSGRFISVFSNYKVNSLDTSSFYILMA